MPPRHLLVLRAGAIGDLILTLPALAALRRAYPGARVTLVGNARAAPLAVASGFADAAEPFDAAWVAGLFEAPSALPPDTACRVAGVDLAIVWLRDPEGPVAANLRGLGIQVLAAPSFPPAGSRIHVADHLLATLAPLARSAIFAGGAQPRVVPFERDRARAEALWAAKGLDGPAPVVAIHPGSGGARKNWPPERFAAVADRLAADGARVLLVAGPADAEPVAEVRRLVRSAPPADLGAVELGELAAILARCAAYLGNDSGVSHLAAAVGAPTVAVFGPTDPAVWAPRGERVTVLWKGMDATGNEGEPALAGGRAGSRLVEVDEVVRAVRAWLGKGRGSTDERR